MTPGPRRFFRTACIVFAAATVAGLGNLLTQGERPRPGFTERPGAPVSSGEDAGFSIALAQPREPYVLGLRTVVIEPRVPPGDAIVQVDFFVDGKLVDTDRTAPYGTTVDFGGAIVRHAIVVTAVTAGGRRARVSYVTRSGDLTEGAADSVAVVPALVRDRAGRPVGGLSVSDFTLEEEGVRQSIVHFTDDPAPVSVAVVVQASAAAEPARSTLLQGAAAFASAVPAYYALRFFDRQTPPDVREEAYGYGPGGFSETLARAGAGGPTGPSPSPGAILQAAASSLATRPGGRAVVLLLAADPVRLEVEPAPAAGEAGATPPVDRRRPAEDLAARARAEEMSAALEAIARAHATLHVVLLGADDSEAPPELRAAVESTGGDLQDAASAAGFEAACLRATEALLGRYLIAYAPQHPERKGRRAIAVRLGPPGLEVRAPRSIFTE